MCGIFSILNYEINNTIYKSFLKGQNRGPEYSNLSVGCLNDPVILGFHRLAINGLNSESTQPFFINNIKLICNGEIYNYKDLAKQFNIILNSESDCEIIIHLYKQFGIEHTLKLLDGVFALILIDYNKDIIYVARDRFGVRPLFQNKIYHSKQNKYIYSFASEMKMINDINFLPSKTLDYNEINTSNIEIFQPGTYSEFTKISNIYNITKINSTFYTFPSVNLLYSDSDYNSKIINTLSKAVYKRVIGTSSRPIACLLSGGLDSSLICALVQIHYRQPLETFSIGLKDSEDIKNATLVANYLGTKHTNIILTEEEFFNAIPEVIKSIESYDTTTIRASVGNYLIGKYIKENSKAKVIFNGDGADELMGGYLYFNCSPDAYQFDQECKRLLSDIHYFDVLRSDRCISDNGLEPRTPFLDIDFVDFYLSLSPLIRFCNNRCEKFLIREAFTRIMPNILPKEILWRKKEAFSDGVSSLNRSWFQIINEKLTNLKNNNKLPEYTLKYINLNNLSLEKAYYLSIFEQYYPNQNKIIPYYWMPKFIKANDASARTLNIY